MECAVSTQSVYNLSNSADAKIRLSLEILTTRVSEANERAKRVRSERSEQCSSEARESVEQSETTQESSDDERTETKKAFRDEC